MSATWTVIISPDAREEVRAIYQYIAFTLLAPEAAEGQVNRILNGMQSLENMAMRHTLYEKEPWRSRGLRKLVIDNYIVFYITNEQAHEAVILHVFYGGQNIDEILQNEA